MRKYLLLILICVPVVVAVFFAWLLGRQEQYDPICNALDALLEPIQDRVDDPVTLRLRLVYTDDGEEKTGHVRFMRRNDDAFAVSVLLYESGPAKVGESAPFLLSNLGQDLRGINQVTHIIESLTTGSGRFLLPTLLLLGRVQVVPVTPPEALRDAPRVFSLNRGSKEVARVTLAPVDDRLMAVEIPQGDRDPLVLEVEGDWACALPSVPEETEVRVRHRVPRRELETTVYRALLRLAQLEAAHLAGAPPDDKFERQGDAYLWIEDGQRIAKLTGGPREIGVQHGILLAPEVRRMVDTTLYLVGLAYSFEREVWFLDVIRGACERLDAHTPPEFLEEMEGLAEGSGVSFDEIHLANYFPALFHCSGFAVQGSATVDGTLYHGRILDYMTEVGLQEAAVLFVVDKAGKIPFCNVGYAGFVGSVTGMNREKVSLGEMGGGGEGDWDGVSMPILMRMALEDARTLEEAKAIFRDNPRTCEYYYVFADGKDRSAVGVAAVPDHIDFIEPGAAHPRLQRPVEDCVLLSAGNRYENLCDRVEEWFGTIDADKALQLMDYPVAMRNANLHSVLFAPETLEFWVANAGVDTRAYEEPYYRYSLPELLDKTDNTPVAGAKGK
jgi:hypothetical protein